MRYAAFADANKAIENKIVKSPFLFPVNTGFYYFALYSTLHPTFC